ncbi:diacylglycerol kinase family protein [Xanthobacter sp. DSM 24535]|uniref:diacylglycerol/lipid kinase family protein n=1 Tax=Roseixanthobacter psychrophilus TaxID=3119917 RepID=UPI00372B8B2E
MGRTLVVLNAKAGTVQDLGGERLRREVDEALTGPGKDVDVVVLEGHEMIEAIRSVRRKGYDALVVGAGDGTLSYATSVLAGTETALGVLPLGTMNLLAHDIGLPRDLPGALQGLRDAEPRRVDVATLNGRAFHGVSGVGFFSQMALAREAVRDSRGRIVGWLMALGKALIRSGRMSLEIEIEDRREPIDAYAALVTNNPFDAPGWHRSRLDAGELEIHIAEERGALAKVRVGADLLVDSWRNNPGIHSFRAKALTIHAPRRRRAWVATDGEITRETMPLHYRIMPKALTLLLPPASVQRAAKARLDDVT